nr:hypothetical protein B0A51_05254 [Rachicladosporium sp. CCFEE 5018]
MTSSVSDMQSAARLFFTSPHIAVAGASSDASKFGYKIFAWYLAHSVTPTPVNPSSASVNISGQNFNTAASPAKLSDPTNTSLSVITPPAVTKQLLKVAKDVGIRSVWLQPGTFDDSILAWAKEAWPGALVGGFDKGTRGGEGWCILVDGEKAKKAAEKDGKLTGRPNGILTQVHTAPIQERKAHCEASWEAGRSNDAEVILDVGGILLAVLVGFYPLYAMYRAHHTPHTHPFVLNITQYTDLAACTSHAGQGITASVIWSPNHDIQWLEDFGHCLLSFCKTADCTETAWVLEDVAKEDVFDKCLDLAPYTPLGVIVECERDWEATFCEKYNGLKFRKQGCEAFGRYGRWYKKIRGALTY